MRGYRYLSEPKKIIEVRAGHMKFNPYWADLLFHFD
jgi:hypothetical protein